MQLGPADGTPGAAERVQASAGVVESAI
jgi:hypothetical protein